MAEEKGKRGGARPGAGRPKTDSKLIAFRVPKEMATYIEQHPNKTKFIKTCIERNMAAQKNNDIEKKLGNLIPASQMKSVCSKPQADPLRLRLSPPSGHTPSPGISGTIP